MNLRVPASTGNSLRPWLGAFARAHAVNAASAMAGSVQVPIAATRVPSREQTSTPSPASFVFCVVIEDI
ncbi:hypothetical protein D3C81_1701870 [compost metagenome]